MDSTYLTEVQQALEINLKPVFVVYFPEFVNKFPDEDMQGFVMREYAEQLIKHRISSTQLRFGMEKCKTLKFRPNPYEFAMLCKPSATDLNLPDPIDAFNEIICRWGKCKGKPFTFSHRVVELTSERIGYKIYHMPEHAARALFDGEYAYWVDRACKDDLPEPLKAIEYIPPDFVPIQVLSKGMQLKGDARFDNRLADLGSKLKRGGLANAG